MANVLKLLHGLSESPSSGESAAVSDFNLLNAREMHDLNVGSNDRYNVDVHGIGGALRSISVSYADIPALSAAEFAHAGNTGANHAGEAPSLEIVDDNYQPAQAAPENEVTGINADNFMAVGELAHAAYQAQSDDRANAERVQAAWQNYGQAGPRQVIDPADIPTAPTQPEAATLAEQNQYLTRIADASEPVPGGQAPVTEVAGDHNQAMQVEAATIAVNEFWATQARKPQPFYPGRQQNQQSPQHPQYPRPVPVPSQPTAANPAPRPYDPYQEYAERRAA